MIKPLTTALVESQNSDGGWGSVRGKRSNCEATSLALLGLATVETPKAEAAVGRGIQWLLERRLQTGGWEMYAGDEKGSWATPLALLALAASGQHETEIKATAAWLSDLHGQGAGWLTTFLYRWFPETLATEVDPNLKGWAWYPGASSWVEPTSYCVLALKKVRSSYPEIGEELSVRISEGERMLYDRACYEGGWNYGNKKVLGETMPAFPDVTALVLIALQDQKQRSANVAGIDALQTMLDTNGSGLTLALSLICNQLYERPTERLVTNLVRSYHRTGFLGETRTMGLALSALTDPSRWRCLS